MYHKPIGGMTDKSYQSLHKPDINVSMELQIMAAQEQALSTKVIEASVQHQTRPQVKSM